LAYIPWLSSAAGAHERKLLLRTQPAAVRAIEALTRLPPRVDVNGSGGGVSSPIGLGAGGRRSGRVACWLRGMVFQPCAGQVGKQLPDSPVDLIADRADSFQVGPARRRLIAVGCLDKAPRHSHTA